MTSYNFKTVTEAWSVLYEELANTISDSSCITDFFTSSPRGRKCNESIGLTINILEPQNCLMWSKVRGLSPIYLAKEYMWYKSGSRDVNDAPSKVWNGLVNTDDDDKGLINSNYGAYVFAQKDNKNPELSVFDATIELLKKDSDSRQAILQIPIMNHRQDSDTPCTSTLHFLLRDGKLNCITYMRSCDAWFGFPNDATQFIMWQMEIAKALDVELGWYRHIFGSFHVYEENFIANFDEYRDIVTTDVYICGNQGVPYFKFYDDRDYREIFDEIVHDFKVLSTEKKEDIISNNLLYNEQLIYMLKNMNVKKFIH